MRTLRSLLAVTVILALLGGVGSAAAADTEPVGPSARSDILPGVELAVEEVEPGVYRVIDDGVRGLAKANDFDIAAGQDGGIWLLRSRWFFRLGTEGAHAWPTETPKHADFEVAPDGTVWVQAGALQSFDGEGWTTHDGHSGRGTLEVARDGTVWTTWVDPESVRLVFGYLADDGWQVVGGQELNFGGWVTRLHVAGPDGIWAEAGTFGPGHVQRFVDGAWQRLIGVVGGDPMWQRPEDPAPDAADPLGLLGLGPDGTAWLWDLGLDDGSLDLVRFDGSGWSRWSPGREFSDLAEVAADGSLWFPQAACRGVGHFDGETWTEHLAGLCVKAIDVTADGAVWLLAKEPSADRRHVYVITPEAVTTRA